jgi:predicted Zn-ribbon and HTH transcriptional regulator
MPCLKECQNGSEFCPQHSKAMGIKPVKPAPKMNAIPKVSAKKKLLAPIEKADKERLKKFYNEMLNIMPYDCMNCGNELFSSTVINPRTVVAHILPKAKFKSIDANIDNVLFLCCECHNKYDLQSSRFMKEQPISNLIKQRVRLLIPLLSEAESKKVPNYLL